MNKGVYMLGLLLAATVVPAAEMRTWTFEESGKTIQAEVLSFADDAVILREADGKTVSVPISYLVESNRTYLAAERARQWKQVEVVKLEGEESGGRYKKCTVRGPGVNGEILIERLPPAVEAILIARNQRAAPIAVLSQRIKSETQAVQEAKTRIPTNNPGYWPYRQAIRMERAQINMATRELKSAQANLARFQKAYDDYVEKTRDQTIVTVRNTGISYRALAVWECSGFRRPAE